MLTLLWIFVGLNGVRHMLIIGAPMLLFAFIALIQAMNDCGWAARTPWRQQALWHTDAVRLVWIMLGSCLCFLTGYILNQQVLAPYYQLAWSPVLNVTPTLAPEKFTKVLNMWLMAIGARRTEEPLVSMRGVALGAALFPAVYCLICSLGKWREKALGKAMLQSLLGLSMLISTGLFLLEGTTRYYELYYVPVLALTFPLLAVALDKLPAQKLGQRALTVIACLCLVFGGGYTAKFMLTKDETMDGWSGLNFGNMNVVEELRDCVEFMQEEEYTHAVIDYWYANPMMELSNGELTVAPMELTFAENEAQEDTLSISPWGTSKTAFRPENLPDTVLVFLRWENELPTFLERFPDAVLVWESAPFSACEIDKELLTY